jgi:hypothetical protein
MRVYYSPLLERYIDLDSITAISDARFLDPMGGGGYFVRFEISLKLHDKPLSYVREIKYRIIDSTPQVELIDGTWGRPEAPDNNSKIAAVANLQEKIEVLVQRWARKHWLKGERG